MDSQKFRLERVVDFFFGVMWKAGLGALLGLVGGVLIGAALGAGIGPFGYLESIVKNDGSKELMDVFNWLYSRGPSAYDGDASFFYSITVIYGLMLGGMNGLMVGPICGAIIGGIGAMFAWAFPLVAPLDPDKRGYKSAFREIALSLTGKGGALLCGVLTTFLVTRIFHSLAVANPEKWVFFGFFGTPDFQIENAMEVFGLVLGAILSLIAWSPQPLTVRTVGGIAGMLVISGIIPIPYFDAFFGFVVGAASVDIFAALRKPEYQPRILIGVAVFIGLLSGGLDAAALFGVGMWLYLNWQGKRSHKPKKVVNPVRTLTAQGMRVGAKTGLVTGGMIGFIFVLNVATWWGDIWHSTILVGLGGFFLVGFGGAIVGMIVRKTPPGARIWLSVLSGLGVGMCFGMFGELVYLALGGFMISTFAPPYDQIWVRGLTASIVGALVGWMIYERWYYGQKEYDAYEEKQPAAVVNKPKKKGGVKGWFRRMSLGQKIALGGCGFMVMCVTTGLFLAFASLGIIFSSFGSAKHADWSEIQSKLYANQELTVDERVLALQKLNELIEECESIAAPMRQEMSRRVAAGAMSQEQANVEIETFETQANQYKKWRDALLHRE